MEVSDSNNFYNDFSAVSRETMSINRLLDILFVENHTNKQYYLIQNSGIAIIHVVLFLFRYSQ